MIILILSIAAFFNAAMDVLQHKFESSIFRNLDPNFFNPHKSYLNKYKGRVKENGRKYPWYLSGLTDTFSDAWHIFKFILISCIISGFSLSKQFDFVNILIYFLVWGFVFWISYNWLLVSKK